MDFKEGLFVRLKSAVSWRARGAHSSDHFNQGATFEVISATSGLVIVRALRNNRNYRISPETAYDYLKPLNA
jgi:hypothetical protein